MYVSSQVICTLRNWAGVRNSPCSCWTSLNWSASLNNSRDSCDHILSQLSSQLSSASLCCLQNSWHSSSEKLSADKVTEAHKDKEWRMWDVGKLCDWMVKNEHAAIKKMSETELNQMPLCNWTVQNEYAAIEKTGETRLNWIPLCK